MTLYASESKIKSGDLFIYYSATDQNQTGVKAQIFICWNDANRSGRGKTGVKPHLLDEFVSWGVKPISRRRFQSFYSPT